VLPSTIVIGVAKGLAREFIKVTVCGMPPAGIVGIAVGPTNVIAGPVVRVAPLKVKGVGAGPRITSLMIGSDMPLL
jgi:hypothetical protein